MGRFRIATYNCNSIRSRLHIVIPWLQEHQPTVLCLQETKVADPHFPAADFTAVGYHVYYKGEGGYNGVAIAAAEPLQEVNCGLDDGSPPDPDRLLWARVGGIWVVNTYVPQGRDRNTPQFQYKLEWFRRLKAFFTRHFTPADPIIWCGDLNVAPEAIDVHNPKRLLGHVCFTPEVWERFADVTSWGFVDIFRKHHPGEVGQYTFFDYRVPQAIKRRLGWRVDHILATETLAQRSQGCTIDMGPRMAKSPSDHTILFADFAA